MTETKLTKEAVYCGEECIRAKVKELNKLTKQTGISQNIGKGLSPILTLADKYRIKFFMVETGGMSFSLILDACDCHDKEAVKREVLKYGPIEERGQQYAKV